MHIVWEISIGNILTIASLLALLAKLNSFHNRLLLEHEILIADYCERNEIEKKDLPTRMKILSIFGGEE